MTALHVQLSALAARYLKTGDELSTSDRAGAARAYGEAAALLLKSAMYLTAPTAPLFDDHDTAEMVQLANQLRNAE